MDWEKEKNNWPNSELSQFINCPPHLWHVQDTQNQQTITKYLPTLLLIHGAGASTHSWRLVLNKLKSNFRVVVVDLPGHGFTKLGAQNRSSLELITLDLVLMLNKLEIQPNLIIGHSAGSAVAINLGLDPNLKVDGILCLNGALGNFSGFAGILYPFLAKILAMSPFTVPLFTSLYSSSKRVEKFLEMTGSKISIDGVRYYTRLISDKNHVAGTLAMMSQWNLNKLALEWHNLNVPVSFILGEKDTIVQNSDSFKASNAIRRSEIKINKNHGHLMHEETPDLIADQIELFYKKLQTF